MDNIHGKPFAMTFDFELDEKLTTDLATHIGLIDTSICKDTFGEFKAYWVGQPNRWHTLYQWHLKYVQQLKRKRTTFSSKQNTVVGYQSVPRAENAANLVTDENTKALLNRYKQ
ncbi:DnaT-like ssDNA-binding domain-containing protein [Glaciecola sp. 1036]|uniref:DnaT-like ssDNA-binding domain-containing protein n=1 Tax=Alteromonadaceae TaxID=72275 RepID=UPI003D03ED1E